MTQINHPDPNDPAVLDSAIAAAAAAEANATGRIELGYELARVALRAHLAELRRPLPPVSTPVYTQATQASPFFGNPDASQAINSYREPDVVDTAVFVPNCPCGTHPQGEPCPRDRAVTTHCTFESVPGHPCNERLWFNPNDGMWRHINHLITHAPRATLEAHEAAVAGAAAAVAGPPTE
jgi:hypothetical protein